MLRPSLEIFFHSEEKSSSALPTKKAFFSLLAYKADERDVNNAVLVGCGAQNLFSAFRVLKLFMGRLNGFFNRLRPMFCSFWSSGTGFPSSFRNYFVDPTSCWVVLHIWCTLFSVFTNTQPSWRVYRALTSNPLHCLHVDLQPESFVTWLPSTLFLLSSMQAVRNARRANDVHSSSITGTSIESNRLLCRMSLLRGMSFILWGM